MLQAAQVQISMDGKGRALDNILTERLRRTIKYEEVYVHDYASPKEARQQLQDYLQFYNHQRLHQALDYHPPASIHFTGCAVVPILFRSAYQNCWRWPMIAAWAIRTISLSIMRR